MSATLVSYMHSMSKVMKGKKTSIFSSPRISRRGLVCVCGVVTVAALASSVGKKVTSLDLVAKGKLSSSPQSMVAIRGPSPPSFQEIYLSDSEILFSFFHDYVAKDPFSDESEVARSADASRVEAAAVARRRTSTRRRRPSPAVLALQESSNRLRKAARHRDRSKIPLPMKSDDFLVGVVDMLPAFRALGAAIHAAAVKDILGNVKKLRRNAGGRRPNDIRDDVLEDYLTSNQLHPDSSAQASIWLARILDFTHAFFTLLVDRPRDSLTSCLFSAYEATLGKHHNVIMRSLAFALMQIIPDRAAMVRCFDLDDFDQLKPVLRQWNASARPIVDRLYAFHQKAERAAALALESPTPSSERLHYDHKKLEAATNTATEEKMEEAAEASSSSVLNPLFRRFARERRRRRTSGRGDSRNLLLDFATTPPLTLPAPAL